MRQHIRLSMVAATLMLATSLSSSVSADDQIYFTATDNVTNVLVQLINNENVRVDIGDWLLSEHSISIAIANAFARGVQVRLLGDRVAIFESDPHTKTEFYWLANQGVPIRLRFNPTWFPEINHWKAAILAGQNTVLFGSGNFTPFELAPFSSTNYDDESEIVTSDPAIVGAFRTRFDQMWNDTTFEPESIYGGPPYMKSWYDACSSEPTGTCDFLTQFPNPAPMNVDTTRLEPDNPTPPDLIFSQGPDFNNRLAQEIQNESAHIDLTVYRLGVDNITQALLAQAQTGVPVRIIVDQNQYTNPLFPEYELTHANIDKLWAAGIPVMMSLHQGVMHMKTLITSTFATNASSNYTPHWQRDGDYFVSVSTKSTIYQALVNRFQAMWTDTAGFGPLVTTPPNAANLASPGSGAPGVSTTTSLIWNRASFAVSYNVYLGTSSSNMPLVANVPADLSTSPPPTSSWTPPSPLQPGTTYFWQIVSLTNATPVNPNMVASSSVSSFTTASGPPPNLPSPWTSQDVGPTGQAGSASFANGVFTVTGAGADIWGTQDGFQFVNEPVSGNTTIVARVTGMQNTNVYAKAGVMIRASTDPGSPHVILDLNPGGNIEFMTRSTQSGATTWVTGTSGATPVWLQLALSSSTVTASVSSDGSTWTTVGSTPVTFGAGVDGLVVCSHDTNTLNTATFDNVATQ